MKITLKLEVAPDAVVRAMLLYDDSVAKVKNRSLINKAYAWAISTYGSELNSLETVAKDYDKEEWNGGIDFMAQRFIRFYPEYKYLFHSLKENNKLI